MSEDYSEVDWPNVYVTPDGTIHDDNVGLKGAAMVGAEFWNARPELLSIYENSRRTMMAPWTVLGMALTRSLISIPWWVQYKSFMGEAALNLGVVFIGDSGGGKSRLNGLLDAALPFENKGSVLFRVIEVGSGEAMPDVYAHPAEKDDHELGIRRGQLVWHSEDRARCFGFDEVGRMFKLGNRDQGSTILEYVKSGLSGGPFGRNLAKGMGTLLEPNSYRFAFTTNAQPSRSGALLSDDEVEGGFPGRLLWFETRDPRAVTEQDHSPIVPFLVPDVDWWQVKFVNRLPQMDEEHRAEREAYHTDNRKAIDGHKSLLRAKVAIALMRLNGRKVLNDEDWDLAGIVLDESIRVRTWVQQLLAAKSKDADKARGEALARQNVAAEDAAETLKLKRITDLILVYQKQGFPRNTWRGKLAGRDRPLFDDAMRVLGIE